MLSTCWGLLLHHLVTDSAPEVGLWGQPNTLTSQKTNYRIHHGARRLGGREGRGDRLQMDHLVQYVAARASAPQRRREATWPD